MLFNVFVHIETRGGVWNDIYRVVAENESHARFVAAKRVFEENDDVSAVTCLDVSKE